MLKCCNNISVGLFVSFFVCYCTDLQFVFNPSITSCMICLLVKWWSTAHVGKWLSLWKACTVQNIPLIVRRQLHQVYSFFKPSTYQMVRWPLLIALCFIFSSFRKNTKVPLFAIKLTSNVYHQFCSKSDTYQLKLGS